MELKSIQIQSTQLKKGIDLIVPAAAYIAAGIPFNKRHELLINVVLIKVKLKKSYLIIQFQSYFQLEVKFHL
jgi:hypothetical protein